jgi:hypothetical protein
MILGDQGGGGWGYQVVNIGGARGPTLPRNPQSWNPTLAKKTRKNGEPGSPEVAAEIATEVAALPGTEDASECGPASRKSLRP